MEIQTKVTLDDLEELADLYTLTIDTCAGFEKIREKSEPAFRSTADRFFDLHKRHAAKIAVLLAKNGGDPERGGGLMSSVNKLVVTMRSWFDKIDEDIMDQVRRGEEHVLSGFDAAIFAAPTPQDQTALEEMRDELNALLAQTADLD